MSAPSLRVSGYITIGLTSIMPISQERLIESIKQDDSDSITSFYSRNLNKVRTLGLNPKVTQKEIGNVLENKYSNRFLRLNKVSQNYYHYIIKSTNHSIKEIVQAYEKEYDRLIILNSYDLIYDYMNVVSYFKINSFLYQRIIKSGILTNLFMHFGYINKKKLALLLQGSGKGVNEYTFQAIEPVLDKDFHSKVDIIKHKIYKQA
jgi:cytochrome c oxidase subunit IV